MASSRNMVRSPVLRMVSSNNKVKSSRQDEAIRGPKALSADWLQFILNRAKALPAALHRGDRRWHEIDQINHPLARTIDRL